MRLHYCVIHLIIHLVMDTLSISSSTLGPVGGGTELLPLGHGQLAVIERWPDYTGQQYSYYAELPPPPPPPPMAGPEQAPLVVRPKPHPPILCSVAGKSFKYTKIRHLCSLLETKAFNSYLFQVKLLACIYSRYV